MSALQASSETLAALRRARPRSRLVRWTVALLCALVAGAWLSGEVDVAEAFSARRGANLERFLTVDVVPFELRGRPFSLAEHLGWARAKLLEDPERQFLAGAPATLAISVLAIVLAALLAALLLPLAARNVASDRPFERWPARGGRPAAWRLLSGATRALLILLRAIPEYVWAFLLLSMLGPSAWPAVLALALHNAGILGKLGAETVENLDPRPARAQRELGGTRLQVLLASVLPLSLARFLMYFFYRFETCVREATVLGMLGVVSLGYWIQDVRARQFYDEMVLYVAVGALLVLAADLLSALARSLLRRAA